MFINSKSVICSAKNNVFFKNEIFVNRTQFQLQNFRLEKKQYYILTIIYQKYYLSGIWRENEPRQKNSNDRFNSFKLFEGKTLNLLVRRLEFQ